AGKPTLPMAQANAQQPKPRVRPTKLTANDWKSALPRKYPPQLRQGMSDEQLAKDLELQAWAFDFNGGPLRCWLEFKEVGQKTMQARMPAKGRDWDLGVKDGHLVFSVGRGASQRMKGIMKKLGKDAHPESIVFSIKAGNYSFTTSDGGEPLWFR